MTSTKDGKTDKSDQPGTKPTTGSDSWTASEKSSSGDGAIKEMVGSQIKKATDIVHEISTGDLMSVYIIVTLFAVIIAAPIMIQ